ncbi:MAG: hypothetical protein R3F14_11570 [Polyangiaceae bacterium]
MTITTPPGRRSRSAWNFAAGDKRAIDLDAKPAGSTVEPPPGKSGPLVSSSTRRILRPASFAAGGVGVAGFAMFAISGGLASATYDSLDQKCTAGSGTRTCPADAQSQIDEGKTQKDLANVGLVIGAAGLAAGVTMFVLSIEPGLQDRGGQGGGGGFGCRTRVARHLRHLDRSAPPEGARRPKRTAAPLRGHARHEDCRARRRR